MAKIEEVTAMLIDEIATFEKAIKELKEESEKIKTTSFSIDSSQIETTLSEFSKQLNDNYELQYIELLSLQNKLNKTVIIPNWMTILFSSFFIIFILSFGFNFYQYQQKKEIKITSYNKGVDAMKNHMQLYFNKNPKTFKHYRKWSKSKNK